MPKNTLLRFNAAPSHAMATSFTSAVSNIQYMDNIGYQYNITSGAPSGTFSVQVSADYQQDPEGVVTNPGNWIALLQPGGTTPVAIAVTIFMRIS